MDDLRELNRLGTPPILFKKLLRVRPREAVLYNAKKTILQILVEGWLCFEGAKHNTT